jgi:peptidylprolyl isomerase
VGVLYTGWTTSGHVVDTTEPSYVPKEFGVFRALPGFQEGLQRMKVGETRRLWIPQELAYAGERGKPAGMLVFDVKLLDFEPGPTPPEDAAAVPASARRNDSGLAWRVLREGTGDKPGPNASVAARFSVWTPEGKLVDSTEGGHAAATFKLERTIPAFREAFADMSVGERRRVWAPAELARLDPSEDVDPMTVFDLELLSFQRAPQPPASLVPPEDALRSLTGLVSKVLRPGTGDRQPKIGDVVEVAFAGWSDKGEPIDSSYEHGRPAVVRLDQRLPLAWNEALQAMKVGERRLLWMPPDLARTAGQAPAEGTQLLDLELLAIRDEAAAAAASH